jgi:hypothetical protein
MFGDDVVVAAVGCCVNPKNRAEASPAISTAFIGISFGI